MQGAILPSAVRAARLSVPEVENPARDREARAARDSLGQMTFYLVFLWVFAAICIFSLALLGEELTCSKQSMAGCKPAKHAILPWRGQAFWLAT
jgi:hypothetical protein